MHLLSHRDSSLLYQVTRILRVVGWKKKEMEYKMNEILYPLNEVRPFQFVGFCKDFIYNIKALRCFSTLKHGDLHIT